VKQSPSSDPIWGRIANADLQESNLPPPGAEWGQIGSFALTFDGYAHWGSFDKCAEIANRWAAAYAQQQGLPESLTELRTCLFFEQRRWHHFGYDPDEESITYIRDLVEGIRRSVVAGESE
jgi:hypothetical protein